MQIAVLLDDVGTGAQHEMEGVAQNDLGAGGLDLLGGQAFDGAVGAHGHKRGCLHFAAGEGDRATPGGAIGCLQFKFHVFSAYVCN